MDETNLTPDEIQTLFFETMGTPRNDATMGVFSGERLMNFLSVVAVKNFEKINNQMAREAALRNGATHNLYKTGDQGVPDVILDSNGEVVLGLCKECGAAEAELIDRICNYSRSKDAWAGVVEKVMATMFTQGTPFGAPTPDKVGQAVATSLANKLVANGGKLTEAMTRLTIQAQITASYDEVYKKIPGWPGTMPIASRITAAIVQQAPDKFAA